MKWVECSTDAGVLVFWPSWWPEKQAPRLRTAHCDGESNRSAALGMTSFILRERVEGDSLFSLIATRALSVLAKP
jgi:hypothetical protein